MKSTIQLVRMAVGNPDLRSIEPDTQLKLSYFDVYKVKLPLPDFYGVPPDWVFAALSRTPAGAGPADKEKVIEEAESIIDKIPQSYNIVLVSDDPHMHLGDEFGNHQRYVYCLDALELPRKENYGTPPRFAPFVLAVRRRLKSNPISALNVSPYRRGRPVSGWQFFGRKKQLDQIIRSSDNYVIVGARRVGKTSLMQEAARRLKEEGESAYLIDVQNCRTPGDVINEILRVLSPRELASSIAHHNTLGEPILSNVLRRMTTRHNRTTIFLDELGNVISSLPKEDWSFLGVLRKYGQQSDGRFRFVISCFQEIFLRQQHEFTGPLINFAHTMRLGLFRKEEVEQFVLGPLEFWRPLQDGEKKALLARANTRVGRHPVFLQYFCYALFEKIAESGGADLNLVNLADTILGKDLRESFESAVEEFFVRMPSALMKFLFLKRCRDTELAGHDISQTEIDDNWLESVLHELGFASSFQARRNLLEGLEMHGLCAFLDDDRTRMSVATPIVYRYIERTVPKIDSYIKKHAEDVRREEELWDLMRIT